MNVRISPKTALGPNKVSVLYSGVHEVRVHDGQLWIEAGDHERVVLELADLDRVDVDTAGGTLL